MYWFSRILFQRKGSQSQLLVGFSLSASWGGSFPITQIRNKWELGDAAGAVMKVWITVWSEMETKAHVRWCWGHREDSQEILNMEHDNIPIWYHDSLWRRACAHTQTHMDTDTHSCFFMTASFSVISIYVILIRVLTVLTVSQYLQSILELWTLFHWYSNIKQM